MESRLVHLELLLGKRVIMLNGHSLGRVEEVRAEIKSNECYISEFLVGSYAVLARLSAWSIGRAVLKVFGIRRKGGYRIRWDQLDLTDTDKPRLLCEGSQLQLIPEES